MNNNIIEKYITFWIDNGYLWLYPKYEIDKQWWIKLYDEEFIDLYHSQTHLFVLITSKLFIEAVARGVLNKNRWKKVENFLWGLWYFSKDDSIIEELIDEITTQQAIAIRDGTLEEFIENLLPKQ